MLMLRVSVEEHADVNVYVYVANDIDVVYDVITRAAVCLRPFDSSGKSTTAPPRAAGRAAFA